LPFSTESGLTMVNVLCDMGSSFLKLAGGGLPPEARGL
jgi:hypothetical protein